MPFDSELAMRAATYAKGTGRAVAFSLAAFRQAWCGGRALGDADNVADRRRGLRAASRARCMKGAELRATRDALARASARRRRGAGHPRCPSGATIVGEDAPERAGGAAVR